MPRFTGGMASEAMIIFSAYLRGEQVMIPPGFEQTNSLLVFLIMESI